MNENDVILIERYLDNGLSDSERLDFEKRLKADSEFSDLLEFLKDVKAVLAYSSKKELRDKLAHIAGEYEKQFHQDNPHRTGRIIPFRYYAVAASLVAVIVVAVILLFTDKDKPTLAEGNDLSFIRSYISNNPEKVSASEAEILPYYLMHRFGSQSAQNIDSFKIGELPLVVIREGKYQNAYFLSDTLFLFGNFNADMFLFQRNDSIKSKDTLFLKSGLAFYKLASEKTDTIKPLEKVNGNLKNMPHAD